MKILFQKTITILLFVLMISQTAFGFTNGEWLTVKDYEQRQNFYIDRSEICIYAIKLYETLTKDTQIPNDTPAPSTEPSTEIPSEPPPSPDDTFTKDITSPSGASSIGLPPSSNETLPSQSEETPVPVSQPEESPALTQTQTAIENPFTDVDASQFPQILEAYSLGIVSGTEQTAFHAERILTRQELSEIVYLVVKKAYPDLAISTKKTLIFNEKVEQNYDASLQFLVSRGILTFDKNGIIGVNKKVTLKEAVTVLDRVMASAPSFAVVVTELPVSAPISVPTPTPPSAQKKTEKTAYLTFDDGISKNTPLILDILKKYDCKATFFITGEGNPEMIKRISDEGHAIGNHTSSHNYSDIYSSSEAFWKDFNREQDYLESILSYKPLLMRFPGGSNNTVSNHYSSNLMKTLTAQANQKGYAYFDWNVSSGDASGTLASKSLILSNVLDNLSGKKDVVILMHQTAPKTTTVQALPEMIEGLKKAGYTIAPLTEDSFRPQFLK